MFNVRIQRTRRPRSLKSARLRNAGTVSGGSRLKALGPFDQLLSPSACRQTIKSLGTVIDRSLVDRRSAERHNAQVTSFGNRNQLRVRFRKPSPTISTLIFAPSRTSRRSTPILPFSSPTIGVSPSSSSGSSARCSSPFQSTVVVAMM